MLSAYADGRFSFERWEAYMDTFVPGAKELCLQDMRECLDAGYTLDRDFLPVLQLVPSENEKREETIRLFGEITRQLDEKIGKRFHRTVDADIVLYLGLCNGAGWVTRIGDRTTVLLGIEKIIELGWCSADDMNGLIVHEIGHVFQSQYGLFDLASDRTSDRFLWQLFTEGVAMVFEQEIVGNPSYYHQDRDGWSEWCGQNLPRIAKAFSEEYEEMTQENQRYFGDWVDFEGRSDVGYYLGTAFVRFLMQTDSFENVIRYDADRVREAFGRFVASL